MVMMVGLYQSLVERRQVLPRLEVLRSATRLVALVMSPQLVLPKHVHLARNPPAPQTEPWCRLLRLMRLLACWHCAPHCCHCQGLLGLLQAQCWPVLAPVLQHFCRVPALQGRPAAVDVGCCHCWGQETRAPPLKVLQNRAATGETRCCWHCWRCRRWGPQNTSPQQPLSWVARSLTNPAQWRLVKLVAAGETGCYYRLRPERAPPLQILTGPVGSWQHLATRQPARPR